MLIKKSPLTITTPELVTVYSGTSTPSSSLGKNGDVYLLVE